MSFTIALIVARATYGVIGRNNQLPWSLPADLKFFKTVTMGKPLVMGRRTWESLGRVLPGRLHVVVSGSPRPNELPEEVLWVSTLNDALGLAEEHARQKGGNEIMVIGGAQLFSAALPQARRIYLTSVNADVEGDVVLPLELKGWTLRSFEAGKLNEKNTLPHFFSVYERGYKPRY